MFLLLKLKLKSILLHIVGVFQAESRVCSGSSINSCGSAVSGNGSGCSSLKGLLKELKLKGILLSILLEF